MNDCIESVELCFENLETVEFDADYIGEFFLADIKTSVERTDFSKIRKISSAGRFHMEVFATGDGTYKHFGEDVQSKFRRVSQKKDITQITLNYRNGMSETFYIDYDDGAFGLLPFDAPNIRQTSRISASGSLLVVVDPDKTVDDVFPDGVG